MTLSFLIGDGTKKSINSCFSDILLEVEQLLKLVAKRAHDILALDVALRNTQLTKSTVHKTTSIIYFKYPCSEEVYKRELKAITTMPVCANKKEQHEYRYSTKAWQSYSTDCVDYKLKYYKQHTSCRHRPVAADWPRPLPAAVPTVTAWLRNCCKSFSDRLRPVPSYLSA